MEEKVVKKKKNHFFEIYISKVQKQIAENCGITLNAKQQLNSFLCFLCKHICNIVRELTLFSKKKTISEKEIINSLNIILSAELLKNSIIEGEKAVNIFKNNEKKGSRQTKAEIIFSPSIIEKFLRDFSNSKLMISSSAPVFLSAVFEYLTYEILDISTIYCKDNDRARITIRDMQISVRSDEELNNLFEKLNVSFIGGGVLPYIHPSLLKKNVSKKNKKSKTGTVAIRDIKKYQKNSDSLILPKSTFEKIVREIFREHVQNNSDIKISKNVFVILQYFIEQYVVKLFYDSNFLAIHSNRIKVISTDIAFISYMYKDSKNPYNSSMIEESYSNILSIYNDTLDQNNIVIETNIPSNNEENVNVEDLNEENNNEEDLNEEDLNEEDLNEEDNNEEDNNEEDNNEDI
jgi:histone H3/H4